MWNANGCDSVFYFSLYKYYIFGLKVYSLNWASWLSSLHFLGSLFLIWHVVILNQDLNDRFAHIEKLTGTITVLPEFNHQESWAWADLLHTWRLSFCLVQACSPTQWSLCQQIQGLLAALGNMETSTFRNEVMHVFPRSIAASLPSLGQALSATTWDVRKPCFTRWESSPTASRGSPAHIFLQCV